MELDFIRKQLNMYDNMIKNMITLRMALIPIVAKIKKENNLPLFQGKREEEIYKNIEAFAKENEVDEILLKDIYKLMISNALEIEESIVNNEQESIINKNINNSDFSKLEENYKKLDEILSKDIPSLLEKIKNDSLKDLSLTEKTTIYYNKKGNN